MRRSGDHRLVFGVDLDRVDSSRGLWWESGDAEARASRLASALRAAIASALTDKQREVVEAYFFEGASQGEIARRLGVSQQVVSKRLFGACRGDKVIGGAITRLRHAMAPHVLSSGAAEEGS